VKDRLGALWNECRNFQDLKKKGPAFEEFAVMLFGEVFEVVEARRLTSFGEIDLVCEVTADAFWIRWPGDCFVECKNVRGAIPVSVVNEFVGKCSTSRVGLAFLMCTGKLTEPATERLARSWSQAEIPDMVWIDGNDIEKWMAGTDSAESFLKRVTRRASYGTRW
jgi:hypothetical protein